MAFEKKKTAYLRKLRGDDDIVKYLIKLDSSHELVYPDGSYVKTGTTVDGGKHDKLCYFTVRLHATAPTVLILQKPIATVETTPARLTINKDSELNDTKANFFAAGSSDILVCATRAHAFETAVEKYIKAHPFTDKEKEEAKAAKASKGRRNSRKSSRKTRKTRKNNRR